MESGPRQPTENFTADDLRIEREERIATGREHRRRLSAARAISIIVLPAVAFAALFTLLWYPSDPPAWAQPALFSILTAVVAFPFSDRNGNDRRGRF
jgi:hypothetical protein